MVNLWLILAAGFAVLNWIATARQWRRAQVTGKIAALAALIAWFTSQGGWSGNLVWFGAGLVFGLAGDILLDLSPRFFIFGLVAFLVGHISYIFGFLSMGSWLSPLTGAIALFVLLCAGLNFARLLRRMDRKPENAPLRRPVLVYGLVISTMLVCAAWTLTFPAWQWAPAICASVGGLLFVISDTALAYQVFVQPFNFSGLLVMVTYHLAQGLIAVGALLRSAA